MNQRSELKWLLLSCALSTSGLAHAQTTASKATGTSSSAKEASTKSSAKNAAQPTAAQPVAVQPTAAQPAAAQATTTPAVATADGSPPAPAADAPLAPTLAPSEPEAADATASAPTPAAEATVNPATSAAVEDALKEGAVDLDIEVLVVTESELDQAIEQRVADGESGRLRWLVGYRITRQGERARLEIAAVPPNSRVRHVAVDVLDDARLELRAMVLLREVVQTAAPKANVTQAAPTATTKERSSGRAILALNGALLGGYIGVSLQQASDSEDNRLLYPLAALGVGLGLGASMLIADEWDITTEDAWFLSAGLFWPTTSGSLIAASYDVEPNDRYLYGLSGATVGLTLSGITVAQGGVHSGGAAIAHSGGAFGQGLGALTEGIVKGDLEDAPLRGMGFGTGIGVLTAGALATQIETSPSRVLLVDLAGLLGGLTGGALATPLLLVEDVDNSRRRMWFGAIAAGTVVGGALGVLATSNEEAHATTARSFGFLPYGGVIAESRVGLRTAPAYGGGIQGFF